MRHYSDKELRDWSKANLKRYLNPREYKLVFDRLHADKRSQQLTRVELGLLKLMLGEFRPERADHEQKRYAESNAVKLTEIADKLGCATTTVNRAKARLNDLAKRSQRLGVQGRRHGLILFHDLGICVQATFWDAIRAHEYSEKMGSAQLETHTSNIALADEKRHDLKHSEDRVRQFSMLTPAEQERALANL